MIPRDTSNMLPFVELQRGRRGLALDAGRETSTKHAPSHEVRKHVGEYVVALLLVALRTRPNGLRALWLERQVVAQGVLHRLAVWP